jgi:hypothetical protein
MNGDTSTTQVYTSNITINPTRIIITFNNINLRLATVKFNLVGNG